MMRFVRVCLFFFGHLSLTGWSDFGNKKSWTAFSDVKLVWTFGVNWLRAYESWMKRQKKFNLHMIYLSFINPSRHCSDPFLVWNNSSDASCGLKHKGENMRKNYNLFPFYPLKKKKKNHQIWVEEPRCGKTDVLSCICHAHLSFHLHVAVCAPAYPC